MSTLLQPVLLDCGLNALWNSTNDGLTAQISHIALGDMGYQPVAGQSKLRAERVRYPIAGSQRIDHNQIHLTALADGEEEFFVREVGFVLADGTLLAIWSDPQQVLAYKAANVDLLLAYDLNLSALPVDSITVNASAPSFNLSLSTEFISLANAIINLQHHAVKPYCR